MSVLERCATLCHCISVKHVSIFKKPNSPYYYTAYFDPAKNRRVWKSSGIRIDDPLGRRKVLELARSRSEEAKALKPILATSGWDSWVEPWLHMRYGTGHATTLSRALGAWNVLREWLDDRGLSAPAQIEHKHASDWISWRTSQKRPNGGFITRNTALQDLKFFNMGMREAVKRGFCATVQTEKQGFKPDAPKQKPEITEEQDALIRRELKARKKPEWMHDSYEVAMAQGCRISETATPMEDINEAAGIITFDAKGSHKFATRLHPALLPLIKRRRKQKQKLLVDMPSNGPRYWTFFLDDIGLPDHSFHCTRVTVVTKLARAGVPISQAMAFVGHASELVHSIYMRLLPADLSLAVAALSVPPGSAKPGTPGSPSPKSRKQPAS